MAASRYELDDCTLEDLYRWIDSIPLSRPKKHIARDFSDGVLMAEIMKRYIPKSVELHNYVSCHSTKQKIENWRLLNTKAFSRFLNFELSMEVIQQVVDQKPGAIERILLLIRDKLDITMAKTIAEDYDSPEADQYYSSRQSQQPPTLNDAKVVGDVVPRLLYEEKVQECLARDESIEILHAKIRRLEHLLDLKSKRVEDLQQRLNGLRPTGQPLFKTPSEGRHYNVHRIN